MFCSQCGKELPNDAKFCDSCGTALQSGVEKAPVLLKPNPFAEPGCQMVESNDDDVSPSVGRTIMQFIRGLPFGFVFLAFLLPLFILSCNGITVNEFSAYDLLNLKNEIANQGRNVTENLDNICLVTIMGTALFSCIILAFGSSFANGKSGGFWGFLGLVDLVALAVFFMNKVKETIISVKPGSGFIVAAVLIFVGMIMCFISPQNGKKVPRGEIIGLSIIAAAVPVVYVLLQYN